MLKISDCPQAPSRVEDRLQRISNDPHHAHAEGKRQRDFRDRSSTQTVQRELFCLSCRESASWCRFRRPAVLCQDAHLHVAIKSPSAPVRRREREVASPFPTGHGRREPPLIRKYFCADTSTRP